MERDDVPEGSFELDPTSLPIYQVDVCTSSIDQSAIANFMDSINSAENWVAPIPNQVPEPEFYKFAAERSPEKFQIGQCWAIYSDEDALPRCEVLRVGKKLQVCLQGSSGMKICVSEHLRFSHRIPAFRLTEERGGNLRGFRSLIQQECLCVYYVLIEASNFSFLYLIPKWKSSCGFLKLNYVSKESVISNLLLRIYFTKEGFNKFRFF
ncbi:hypothetical protein MTR67_002808 [Solanum verrucosum]|uniref:DUF3444 domain-containing protein n=1 Tax=Solanum verrucosum TaxID=315347 RepID=A0AAF0PR89_SOLVR|nr:hypothetical protein MTR67_002808 [Solanum verrucosum]